MTRERLRWGAISTANIGRTSLIPAIQRAGNGDVVYILHDLPVRYPQTEAAANMGVIDALYRSARNGGQPEPVAT